MSFYSREKHRGDSDSVPEIMGLHEFIAVQNKNAEKLARAPHFWSLIPLIDQMYEAAGALASSMQHSPTLIMLLMVCCRDLYVAASQIQRGLPFDSHANTRRAVEAAKVALAIKRDRGNIERWLKTELRQQRWDARQQGIKPKPLPPNGFTELHGDPLVNALEQYFGIASDAYIHFTPEFFGRQDFTQSPPNEDDVVLLGLNYFGTEREILLHAVLLAGLHMRILLLFDSVFEGCFLADPGWVRLRTKFDQMATDLLRDIPPLPAEEDDRS